MTGNAGVSIKGVLLLIAVFALILPALYDRAGSVYTYLNINTYSESISGMDPEGITKIKNDAFEYNERIMKEQKKSPFSYRGSDIYDSEYKVLLNIDHGVMAYLEIPSVDLFLPVMHGTDSEVLEKSLGHMYGTSLPVGGEGCNCVIPGHTGLKRAKLFTDLIYVGVGDVFYIHVLDEVHEYTVTGKAVCLPEDEASFLQVSEGKDIVTLYTCTPYGINDHRLIVTGERTGLDKSGKNMTAVRKGMFNKRPLFEALYLVFVLLICLLYLFYKEQEI